MAQILLENVSFSYDKNHNALNNVSLSIEKGEYVAILGHNGSGKSTLAKLLNGLITANSGNMEICGLSPFEKKNLFEIRKKVGVIFQNPDNQLVASIVEDDVAFGPENLGVKRDEIAKRIDFALSSVNMLDFKKSSPTRLSGGQKQRIAIAGVLALQPQVLVLDESTSMLDPRGREEVLSVVKKLNESGVTVIAITHYMDEAVEADKIYVLSGGEVVCSGTPNQVFAEKKALEIAGLELPLSQKIANQLKQNGIPMEQDVLTENSLLEGLCKLL
ncbi:MAG: energy-coupling factor transporter ATPase [Clostridia bacterium]|nr:energy-coupling factor transporter ATPase [Clostridia bacterium]